MIRKRGPNLQVQVYAGLDPLTGRKTWRSTSVPGHTRASWRKAREEEGRLLAEVASGKHRGDASMRLAELLDEWLKWRETNGKPIAPTTLHDYGLIIEAKIKPALGKAKISAIDARVLDRFYSALRADGNARLIRDEDGEVHRKGGPLSAKRVRDVHSIMSGALGLAARWGYLPHNPAILARPPAHRSAPRTLPTPEQVRELLAKVEGEDLQLNLFLRLGATTGLRRGELCALRWCDLDLDAAELTVSGSVTFLKGLPGGYIRKDPKSQHGERVIALDPGTVAELLVWHELASKEARKHGAKLPADAYLFAADASGTRPVRPDAMSKRFSALATSLGHSYTLHGLRHFMATQLGAVAVAATVRGRMGHGSLAVTSIYVRTVAEADRAAAEHMGKVIDG